MNGTKPGYWAAEELNDESGNWTRVWKCETNGACLGGADSLCREGHDGPLCDNCKEGYYADKEHLCWECPDPDEDGGDAALAAMAMACICFGFLAGCAANLLFFKSDAMDAWANFFYRVRTNPILFVTQLLAIKNTKRAARRKMERDAKAKAAVAASGSAPPSPPASPPENDGSPAVPIDLQPTETLQTESSFSVDDADAPKPAEAAAAANGSDDAKAASAVAVIMGKKNNWAKATQQSRNRMPLTDLTQEQFYAIIKQNAKQMAAMFKEIDEDGDGIISKTEFRKAIPLLGVSVPKSDIDELFNKIDKSGDGSIDSSEFLAFFGEEDKPEMATGRKSIANIQIPKKGAAAAAQPAATAAPGAPAGPGAPDMLSLSISLMIVVKFILFDLTGYLQVNSSLAGAMPDLQWPQIFFDISNTLNGIFNLAFLTEQGSLDCWLRSNYCFKVLCICLTILSFQLALPCFYFCARRVHWLVPKSCAKLRKKATVADARMDKLLDRSLHVNVLLAMVAHPPVSKFLLNNLQCSSFNELDVLENDKRLGCGTERMCTGTAGFFMLLYTVGIPLTLGLTLRKYLSPAGKKRFAGTRVTARAKARFGFTCGKYEAEFYAYEVLEITRKYLLTGVSTLVRGGTYSQLVCKIVITMFFFTILVRTTPFNSPQLDMLVCTTHLCTLLTLMASLMMKVGFFEREGVSVEVVAYIMLAVQFFPMMVAFYIVGMALKEISHEKAVAAKTKAAQAAAATARRASAVRRKSSKNPRGEIEEMSKNAVADAEKSVAVEEESNARPVKEVHRI